MKINLGSEVKDTVTGFKGIAICRTEYLTGCARVGVQPKVDKDGKIPDAIFIDELQLEVLKDSKVQLPEAAKDPGGPRIDAPVLRKVR